MKMTRRKAEVEAVVALLEDESFDSGDDMAWAIIQKVVSLLGERDMACLAWRTQPGAPVVAWGPFITLAEAAKFGKSLSVGGEALAVTLYSPQALLTRVEEGESPRVGACKQCSHPWGTHQHEKRAGCQVKGCKCSNLVK